MKVKNLLASALVLSCAACTVVPGSNMSRMNSVWFDDTPEDYTPAETEIRYIPINATLLANMNAPAARQATLSSDLEQQLNDYQYRVGPGDVCLQTFACLTDGRAYSAEGVAETDIDGEILPHALFRQALTTNDTFRAEVLTAVARRFGDYEQLVEDVALTGFDARLARVLLRLASPAGRIETTHEALASETASGRAFVTRRLRAFAQAGLVDQERGRITVLDRAGLERIAADD